MTNKKPNPSSDLDELRENLDRLTKLRQSLAERQARNTMPPLKPLGFIDLLILMVCFAAAFLAIIIALAAVFL
ncbi:hypothetical protein [Moraxella cuniculi]|uniref:Uncharacterized protein n=1 Tax=Moraxella cuniculi TaxID=34061 RepID=A0A448GYR0_9GAMM|nr:hypothetical protein [Moraxella cuniculi]VEG13818.1 Uncharacterised protein [Moraxella cuniculi]